MSRPGFLKRLRRDQAGAAALEFGLLAPIMITMLLGTFQIGLGMQNYDALSSVSADLARVAMTNYQNANRRTDEWLEDRAQTIATAAPYNLVGARLTVNVTAVTPSTVAGTTQKTITLQYAVPSMLGMAGMDDIALTYTREVFLLS